VELEEWVRRMEKLEEWVKGIEKTFIIVEVSEKKVNIWMFYLTGEADIWRSTMKNRLVGSKFTCSKFLEELRAKFYPITIQ